MKIVIKLSTSFKKQAKPLLKKYASLTHELVQLSEELTKNPFLGKEIMKDVYKIRLAVKSKGKGKSGGARVITYHQEKGANIIGIIEKSIEEDETYTVYLISIYDKSAVENISDNEIINIIENIKII